MGGRSNDTACDRNENDDQEPPPLRVLDSSEIVPLGMRSASGTLPEHHPLFTGSLQYRI